LGLEEKYPISIDCSGKLVYSWSIFSKKRLENLKVNVAIEQPEINYNCLGKKGEDVQHAIERKVDDIR
jgi:hypothetical protein